MTLTATAFPSHLLRRAGVLTFAVVLGTAVGAVTGARTEPAAHALPAPAIQPVEAGTLHFPTQPLRSTPQA
jgi:hypothetical protein